MVKKVSDFSRTEIYKLQCKDKNILETYIGYMTNRNREACHKSSCNKETSPDYNDYKYKFIRENGGWDNWELIIIEKYPCNNLIEAREREQYYISKNENSLNVSKSVRTKEQKILYEKNWHETNKEEQSKKYKDKYDTNEEFKNKAIERAKKRQELIKANPEKAEQMRKYKREWAKRKHDEKKASPQYI